MSKGWISINRSLQNHWLYEDKPFCRSMAWIDLLLSANHADNKILFDNNLVLIKRGQLVTSVRKLSEKWGWSKDKTLKFLRMLEKDEMIEKESDTKRTLITIVNYGVYQNEDIEKRTPNGRQADTGKDTDTPQTIMDNNVNKWNKDTTQSEEAVPYSKIVSDYNNICSSFPKVQKISESRKKAVRARLNSGYSIEDLKRAFERAEASPFLKGQNERNWTADFDWMLTDRNLAKVLEGKYDPNTKGNKIDVSGNTDTGFRLS